MKLYYSPGACSLAAHIALREAGLGFVLDKVNLKTKVTSEESDFTRINPKGYVPALQFDDGTVLTEVTAILQWVADEVPQKHLAPPAGTMERYQLIEWLNYIATEIHKTFSPLFDPSTTDELRQQTLAYLRKRLALVDRQLGKHEHLVGEHFTVGDAYLFTVLNWSRYVKFDLGEFPHLAAFMHKVAERPALREALLAERLIKA